MKIVKFENSEIAEFPYLNAGRRPNDFYRDRLPVYKAVVEGMPESIDAMIVTADLQGLACESQLPGGPYPLLGEVLPNMMEVVLDQLGINSGNRVCALLAGDFYTYPDLHGRGGTGDITHVWRAFAESYGWVVGVAGNHDTFGDRQSYTPKMHDPNVHLLDGDRVKVEGLAVAGISGVIGNPRKNFRRRHDEFVETLDLILHNKVDIALMHTGPDFPALKGCKGDPLIREVIETRKPRLLVRGHSHWPVPFVEMDCGTQILNVDATVVVLVRE